MRAVAAASLLLLGFGLAEEELTVSSAEGSAGKGKGVGGRPSAGPSAAIEVTAREFDALLKKEPLALVQLYRPDCGYCQQLEPA